MGARLLVEGFKERAALMQDTLDSTKREMQEREERAKAEQAEMQKNYEKQLERIAEQQEKTAREMSQIAKDIQNAKDGLLGLVDVSEIVKNAIKQVKAEAESIDLTNSEGDWG